VLTRNNKIFGIREGMGYIPDGDAVEHLDVLPPLL
jgi:hypothetical protein